MPNDNDSPESSTPRDDEPRLPRERQRVEDDEPSAGTPFVLEGFPAGLSSLTLTRVVTRNYTSPEDVIALRKGAPEAYELALEQSRADAEHDRAVELQEMDDLREQHAQAAKATRRGQSHATFLATLIVVTGGVVATFGGSPVEGMAIIVSGVGVVGTRWLLMGAKELWAQRKDQRAALPPANDDESE